MLLRLTNIYFDYIEALAYVDPSHADIWKYMNLIRERAGIPGYGTASLPKATTTSEIMKLIQKEKRIELSFENCRYFDVRRWGLTNEFFNKPVHGMNVNYDGNVQKSLPVILIVNTSSRFRRVKLILIKIWFKMKAFN